MFFGVLILAGVISFFKIPIELRPNASFNNISIIANVRGGMPPEETEKQITLPIEEAMSTIPGLKTLQSTSKEGQSNIVLSFPPETDMDIKSLEVSERFDAIKNDLPKEMERPVIAKYEQNDVPVVIISLFSDTLSLEDIRKTADQQIKPFIQRIKNVANVEIAGGREQKIVVDVDERKLSAHTLSLDQVSEAIGKNNLNILAGDMKNEENVLLIRSEALFKDLEEVKNTILYSQWGRDILRVRDVADVSYQYMENSNFSGFNSKPVVSVYIQKESNANTVTVCKNIRKTFSELEQSLPDALQSKVVEDQSLYITEVIGKVLSALKEGALFAIIVLLIFLRDLRSTVTVGTAIPLSLLITLSLMYSNDVSINVMSLSGLALGIGMLVDNSIVVLENASQNLERGKSRMEAAVTGANQVFTSLCASTLTTLIVFIPIVFINAQTKILYGGMALAVAFSLLSSLLVSVTVVPTLFSRGKTNFKKSDFTRRLTGIYSKLVLGALRYRFFISGGILLLLIGALLYLSLMEKDIFGSSDEAKFTVFVELQSGAKSDISKSVVAQVEGKIKNLPDLEHYTSRVEGWSSKIYCLLKKDRNHSTPQVLEEVRGLIKGLGEKEKAFVYTSSGESVGVTEVMIDIYGYQYSELLDISSKISEAVKEDGDFFDFKLRYKPGRPERILAVDHERAALSGFSVQEIADAVHARIRGVRATKIFQNGKEIETIIRLKEENRKNLDEITSLQLVNRQGQKVSLQELVEFREGLAPSEIWHTNKLRMIQVSFSTSKHPLNKAVEILTPKLKAVKLPEDYFIRFGGDYEEMNKTYSNLQIAVWIMLILVFMLLAGLFESYEQSLIIMVTVPLSLIGVSIALGLTRTPMTMGALMGIIILGGMVVNSAILYFEAFNRLRHEKASLLKAVISAGGQRIRPILMTTCTTVFGLLPLAFDKSSASSMWAPLAITVIGGILSSSVLTLIALPSLILILHDFRALLKSLFQAQTQNAVE